MTQVFSGMIFDWQNIWGQGVSGPRHKRGAGPLAGGSEGGQERIEPGGAAPSWSAKKRSRPFLFFVARLIIM